MLYKQHCPYTFPDLSLNNNYLSLYMRLRYMA